MPIERQDLSTFLHRDGGNEQPAAWAGLMGLETRLMRELFNHYNIVEFTLPILEAAITAVDSVAPRYMGLLRLQRGMTIESHVLSYIHTSWNNAAAQRAAQRVLPADRESLYDLPLRQVVDRMHTYTRYCMWRMVQTLDRRYAYLLADDNDPDDGDGDDDGERQRQHIWRSEEGLPISLSPDRLRIVNAAYIEVEPGNTSIGCSLRTEGRADVPLRITFDFDPIVHNHLTAAECAVLWFRELFAINGDDPTLAPGGPRPIIIDGYEL